MSGRCAGTIRAARFLFSVKTVAQSGKAGRNLTCGRHLERVFGNVWRSSVIAARGPAPGGRNGVVGVGARLQDCA